MEHKRTENPCVAGSIPALPSIHFSSGNAVNQAFSAARRLKFKIDPDALKSANKSLNAPTIPCGKIVGARQTREENLAKKRAAQKVYYQQNKHKWPEYVRKYHRDHPDRIRAKNERYRASDEGRAQRASVRRERYRRLRDREVATVIAYEKANPHKKNAHQAVQRAIKTGVLVKLPCACGASKVQAHHEDYSKPLEVQWVCAKCHAKKHPRHNNFQADT